MAEIREVNLGRVRGNGGFSPVIRENPDNTEEIYKLDITTEEGTFTTPNLKGDRNGGAFEVEKWYQTSGEGFFKKTAEGTWMAEVVSGAVAGAEWAVYSEKAMTINIGYSRSWNVSYYCYLNEKDIGHNLGNQEGTGVYSVNVAAGTNTFRVQVWKYSSESVDGNMSLILPSIIS